LKSTFIKVNEFLVIAYMNVVMTENMPNGTF